MKRCKKCGAKIEWTKTENNKWIPMDPAGTSHFETCTYAGEFRGKHFNSLDPVDYGKIKKEQGQKCLEDF